MEKRICAIAIWMAFYFISIKASAQPNQVYAISATGTICLLNPNTASLKTISKIPPNAGSPNALGYKPATNTFYFFASNFGGSNNTFESFVPNASAVDGTFTKLSSVNSPSGKTNAGCISFDGFGYYCIDANGYLYYYKISTNSWQRIATTFKDQRGTDITSLFSSYNSGDIAFDGRGNLWFVAGNGSMNTYCLYKLSYPVPTTNVGTVTATEIVPPGATLPDNDFPVGIAFNNNGQMYISTYTSDVYLWSSLSSTPVLQGQMSQTITDITSGYFPYDVLPVKYEWFKTTLMNNGSVSIAWKAQQKNTKSYTIQRSSAGVNWTDLGSVLSTAETVDNYNFIDYSPVKGVVYYRLKETDTEGNFLYSDVRTVSLLLRNDLVLWPNPFHDQVFFKNNFQESLLVKIVDLSGRLVQETKLLPGEERIDLAHLPPGNYYLLLLKGEQKISQQPVIKN